MRRNGIFWAAMAVMGASLCATGSRADEGMWLFSGPPKAQLKTRYGFEADPAWYTHLQRASVRFNSGGSGSFASSDGLVLTNHHVGADALQKMSTKEKDYVKDGFYAKSRDEEVRCVDLELNVLMSTEDVTARVHASVKAGMTPSEANLARRAAMNTIEKESADATGLRSDVVTLYNGGMYHLYRLKKYTDVRLVFAPEQDVAFFGGDPDNFEYPRFDLDICFFRVYENGKPVKIEHFLKWNAAGAPDGELVFVSGHPGRTSRLNTAPHLGFIRDVQFPHVLEKLFRREVVLRCYGERSRENARRAQDDLFGVANSRKARLGGLEGLQSPAVIAAKETDDAKLRQVLATRASGDAPSVGPWEQVNAALEWDRGHYKQWDLLEAGSGFNSHLFMLARTIVRMVDESAKPNAERIREYRESNLDSLKQMLYSEAPVYPDLEIATLGDSLSMLLEKLGPGDDRVRQVLAGKPPRERAAELVGGTKLAGVAERKRLVEGGREAIRASSDPMIRSALTVDPAARNLRKAREEKVEEPLRQAYAKLATARFEAFGASVYPDATFTLRLAFGVVKGYVEKGASVPAFTTFAGLYRRADEHANQYPFQLPKRWLDRKDKLNLDAKLNFVATPDIIGGNSGSPVVNRKGEFVGIIFDGNLDSLVWDFVYTDKIGRALAVDAAGILEALRKVYDADALADEIGTTRRASVE